MKTKIIVVLMLLLHFNKVVAEVAYSWSDPDTGIEWNYYKVEGGVRLTRVLGDSIGDLIVPSEVDDYPVVAIGYYIFGSREGILKSFFF